jgi:hypothetical protein
MGTRLAEGRVRRGEDDVIDDDDLHLVIRGVDLKNSPLAWTSAQYSIQRVLIKSIS